MPLNKETLLQGGKYKIVRHISNGGFGVTYEAEHVLLHKRLAVKEFFVKDFCNRDETTNHVTVGTKTKVQLVSRLKRKFIDEAVAISSLNHPNIVNVSDVFEENGTAYYIMDYIDGKSLHQLVNENGALPEEVAVGYIRQIADALKYVHSNNRLHLDIKPGNIMVDSHGKAMLIDFGASKQYDEVEGENTSTLMGKTPGYAPIEQMGNRVQTFNPATDIYSLGATLYKLLSGITPPDSTDLADDETLLKPLPKRISETTRKAVMTAMEVKRKNRPQNMKEFIKTLNDTAEKEYEDTLFNEKDVKKPNLVKPKPVKPKSPTPEPKAKSQSYKNYAIISAVITVIAIALFFIFNNSGIEYDSSTNNNSGIEYDSSTNSITYGSYSYKMVYVFGGTFTMGATSEQGSDAYNNEAPTHSVTLSSYYIGQTEVPQWLWTAVMGSNPSNWKGDNLPVEQVSWNDCKSFISKLNSLTGESFALPTEAQWEFAARGGNSSRGYKYSGSNDISSVAWYDGNSGKTTHDVGTKSANELGIYDMSGNVYEWCSDWYAEEYPSSSQTNPTGPSTGSCRVYRSGSWRNSARFSRVSNRNDYTPSYRSFHLGLRLALLP